MKIRVLLRQPVVVLWKELRLPMATSSSSSLSAAPIPTLQIKSLIPLLVGSGMWEVFSSDIFRSSRSETKTATTAFRRIVRLRREGFRRREEKGRDRDGRETLGFTSDQRQPAFSPSSRPPLLLSDFFSGGGLRRERGLKRGEDEMKKGIG